MATSYELWSARMVALGATLTTFPAKTGKVGAYAATDRGKEIPAARFPAVKIAQLNATRSAIGEPDKWSSDRAFGYYKAPASATYIAQQRIAQPTDVEVAKGSKHLEEEGDGLFALWRKLRALGNVAFYVAIAVLVIGGGVVLYNVHHRTAGGA